MIFAHSFAYHSLFYFLLTYVEEEITTEAMSLGGARFITFMIYLTTARAGGFTAFPQPGLSIKPKAGSVLFWFNQGAQNNYDSRIRHCGCPMVYGNKWIANKWIKWFANYKNYPCLINDRHYSIFDNHIRNSNHY